jgi:hypothetical protein
LGRSSQIHLSEYSIKEIEELLQEGRGNTEELEHILRLLKNGQSLPPFDKAYLDKVLPKNASVYRGSNNYKSEGTTFVLSLFFGLIGFMGIGHRYVGNVRRSIGLLYAGWTIMVSSVSIVGLVSNTFNNDEISPLAHSLLPLPQGFEQIITNIVGQTTLIGIAIALPIGYLILLVWQIFDARKQMRFFNERMDKTGKDFFEINITKKIAFAVALIFPILIVFGLALLFGFSQSHVLQ